MSSLLPTLLLSACGGNDNNPERGAATDQAPRETRTLHFDLSEGGSGSALANPQLHLRGSTHHRAPLVAHTNQSRARHRASDAVLRGVPDANLTHYLEDVDLPAAALQLGSVWGSHATTGLPMLALHFIHVPTSSLQALEKRRESRGQAKRGLSAKLRNYGVSQAALEDAPLISQLGPQTGAFDVVTTLLFQHPAITNLDPDLGADIIDRIQNLPCDPTDDTCNPYSGTVMQQVAQMIGAGGYVTTTSTQSWATLTTFIDPATAKPAVDGNGEVIYNISINPALADSMAVLVKQILNDINSDPLFMNTNWQDPSGSASAPAMTAVAAAARSTSQGLRATLGAEEFTVICDTPFHSRRSGVRLLDVNGDNNRNIVVTVVNEFLKSNSVYVQYFDAQGKSLTNTNPTVYDDGDAYYNSVISPDIQVMGVPLLGNAAITSNIRFMMPPEASSARLSYGSLGLGGSDAFGKKALIGSLMTMTLNLFLPTVFLTLGIAVQYSDGIKSAFKSAMEDPVVLKTVLAAVATGLGSGALSGGIQSSDTNLTIKPFLIGMATTVGQILLSLCPRLVFFLTFAAFSSDALLTAIPIVGQVLWMASTAADIATIGETLIECLSCPAIQYVNMSLGMSSSVVVSKDPDDFQFPATARTMRVTATYSGSGPTASSGSTVSAGSGSAGSRTVTGTATLQAGQVAPVTVQLTTKASDGSDSPYVISGGWVTVQVALYNDRGCLVGTGTSQTLVNLPDTASTIPVTIKEAVVPLDTSTSYEIQSTLGYVAGAHEWTPTTSKPVATGSLLCQGNDGALCTLNGLSVNTATGMAGYSFSGANTSISLCGGGSASSMYTIQNVFLGSGPDSAFKSSSCGELQPVGIAYSPTGTQNYFLQLGSDGLQYLRSADLAGGNFNMKQTLTWGRFATPHDSLCVVGGGHVVGVSRTTHKIEVLALPAVMAADNDPQVAKDFGVLVAGKGSRPGLLDTPVAVAAFGDMVYVLEQGNARVQAFELDGSLPGTVDNGVQTLAPFNAGKGPKSSAVFPLRANTIVGTTFLDIAVEGAGYVYVLSYDGGMPIASNFNLDVYTPDGSFLSRTTGVTAANIAVDLFRNVYTLNYEKVANSPRIEPSISQWEPVSSAACAAATTAAAGTYRTAAACQGSTLARS